MNSLLAAEGRKLNSGAGGFGGGISRRVFSSCFRSASLAAAWRLAGESFTLTTDMLPLPEEEPFKLEDETFENKSRKKAGRCKHPVKIRKFCTCWSNTSHLLITCKVFTENLLLRQFEADLKLLQTRKPHLKQDYTAATQR